MKRLSCFFLSLSVIHGVTFRLIAADFYVAPDGHDAGSGTVTNPFRSIVKAVAATRNIPRSEVRRIVVREGRYFNAAIELTAFDSGLTIEAAPNAHPVLYGGQPLRGWEPDGDRWVSAVLPPFPSPGGFWSIRMVLVNGRSRPRARFPAEGTLPHLSEFTVPWMSSTGGGWKRPPTAEELTTLKYRPGDLDPGMVVTNAEITVYHMWDESSVGVAAHDPARQILKLAPAPGHPPGAFGVRKYVVWNIREGMTSPGQWYHDRARNRLVYWPLPGENMAETEVIVPTTQTIIRVRGTSSEPVRDVTLRGLTLSVTTTPLEAGGFAAARYQGAVSIEQADRCRCDGLTVTRVAGQAINTQGRVTGTRIEDCEIHDCGAGGIYVGGSDAVIANNHVHGIGRLFPSAIGIYRGGRNNQVVHNEVHDCTYTGINYGGRSNRIEFNLIYDCMKTLHDGAAIYLFAAQDCVVRRNVARDIIDTGGYGASAYYLDERSRGCLVEENLSLRIHRPSHNHMATNNVIRANVFIVEGDAAMTFPRSEGFTVESNVVYATGKVRVEGVNAVAHWADNLFYSGTGRFECVRLNGYSRTQTDAEPPPGTQVADPMFRDWSGGDFRFQSGSPALKLGIPEIDWSTAGRVRRREF